MRYMIISGVETDRPVAAIPANGARWMPRGTPPHRDDVALGDGFLGNQLVLGKRGLDVANVAGQAWV